MFTNLAKTGRYGPLGDAFAGDYRQLDRDGNPNQDYSFLFFDTNYGTNGQQGGTYTVKFNGRGRIQYNGNFDNTTYDAASNTTTRTITLPANPTHPWINISDTDRDGNYGSDGLPDKDGVTNFRVMIPTFAGSTTSYPIQVYSRQSSLMPSRLSMPFVKCRTSRRAATIGNRSGRSACVPASHKT
jgi:hypothetical protein